ncbi:MAG: hypothetical protein HY036_01400 [Nitrospirae bacterium]|nr:hypothetical protein [Nitrospirota bacterium]MBI3351213.1 hypothetical protein [Nitrospirota bacterium]
MIFILLQYLAILSAIPAKIQESNENRHISEMIDFTMEGYGEGGIRTHAGLTT